MHPWALNSAATWLTTVRVTELLFKLPMTARTWSGASDMATDYRIGDRKQPTFSAAHLAGNTDTPVRSIPSIFADRSVRVTVLNVSVARMRFADTRRRVAACSQADQPKARKNCSKRYPRNAVIGNVRIQAHTMRSTTVHLTALNPLVAPTPMMEVEITWVVESGIPQ